jgi:hypothetical protein
MIKRGQKDKVVIMALPVVSLFDFGAKLMFLWVKRTGLGSPVVPEVKYNPHSSSGESLICGAVALAVFRTSSYLVIPSGSLVPSKCNPTLSAVLLLERF